jgi:protein TonB
MAAPLADPPPATAPPAAAPPASAAPRTGQATAAAPVRPRPAAARRAAPAEPPASAPGDGTAAPGVAGAARAAGAVTPPGPPEGHRNVQPDYPQASRQRGEEGTVWLRLHVAASGAVTQVDIAQSPGHRPLEEAARRAALQWRFRPAMRDGVPVDSTIRTAVHFRLVQ